MKKLAGFWIIFSASPLSLIYFANLTSAAVWCWIWIIVWFLFINWNTDNLTRGLSFIVASVFVAIMGKSIIGESEHKEVIDLIQNVILLISGGVGGSFISDGLLKKKYDTTS